MPALAADIAAASREAVSATWESAPIKARYPGARDEGSPPGEGFFDTQADAQDIADARGDLLGTERGRYRVPASGLVWIDPTAGVPSYQFVDDELQVDAPCLVARIEVDLENEESGFELFG